MLVLAGTRSNFGYQVSIHRLTAGADQGFPIQLNLKRLCALRWIFHQSKVTLANVASDGEVPLIRLNGRHRSRACRQLSHRTTQTSRTPARNVLASLSKRVAIAL